MIRVPSCCLYGIFAGCRNDDPTADHAERHIGYAGAGQLLLGIRNDGIDQRLVFTTGVVNGGVPRATRLDTEGHVPKPGNRQGRVVVVGEPTYACSCADCGLDLSTGEHMWVVACSGAASTEHDEGDSYNSYALPTLYPL